MNVWRVIGLSLLSFNINLFSMDAPEINGNKKLTKEERLTQVEKEVANCSGTIKKIEKIILNDKGLVEPTKPLLLICLELHKQQTYMNSQFESIFSDIDQLQEQLIKIEDGLKTLKKEKQELVSDTEKHLEAVYSRLSTLLEAQSKRKLKEKEKG